MHIKHCFIINLLMFLTACGSEPSVIKEIYTKISEPVIEAVISESGLAPESISEKNLI